MHHTSSTMPLLMGPVFGRPSLDSALRFPGHSRLLHYEIDGFDVRDIAFDAHLVAVALQPKPVRAYRRVGDVQRQEVIEPGGAIVVPQGARHDSTVPGRGIFIMAGLSQQTLEDTADMLEAARRPMLVPTFPEASDVGLAVLMQQAAGIVRVGDLARSVELDTHLHQIAVHLLSRYFGRTPGQRSLNYGLSPLQLRRVTDFVQAHLSAPLSIDQMAAQACLSRHHFLRQFRRATGLTPGQFLIRQRMALARRSLLQSREPVSNIALQCGFTTEAHFAHSFRKRFGQTPSQFRLHARAV